MGFLVNDGLDYLTSSRAAGNLAGGGVQRIRLATQFVSRLTGCVNIRDGACIG